MGLFRSVRQLGPIENGSGIRHKGPRPALTTLGSIREKLNLLGHGTIGEVENGSRMPTSVDEH